MTDYQSFIRGSKVKMTEKEKMQILLLWFQQLAESKFSGEVKIWFLGGKIDTAEANRCPEELNTLLKFESLNECTK